MYNIVAIMGESGAGKDSMLQKALEELDLKGHSSRVHEIVSCTSRPMREGEAHGINYYYYHSNDFETKILNDEMLEFTKFNNWWYGKSYDSLRSDRVVNVGVFNPSGVRQLLDREDCDVIVFWVRAADKTRLLRQLNREENPDTKEIVRRFNADCEDFADIDFSYISLPNETVDDFAAGVEKIVGSVETLFAQRQD